MKYETKIVLADPDGKELRSLTRVKKRIKTADDLNDLIIDALADMVNGRMPIDMAAQVLNGCWKVAKIAALQHRFGEYEQKTGDFTWKISNRRRDEEDDDD